ncbi:MAG: NAD(P)-dependent oxidoreductase [Bacteroidia bacterium]|nr:NAD(P)-dependent oxidoreductase [Bacteroidia bacterium]
MKKILMAGGSGYIGAVLCEYLYQKGYDITIADAGWFGFHSRKEIPVIKGDLFDLTAADMKPFDCIVFLAGLSNDPMAEYSPKENFIYNTALPAYLGFQAREAGVKHFVFASSCSVYGYTHNRTYTETDETICNYPYGVSKLQGEQSLLALQDESFRVVCLRQGTVSGYSPRMRLDLAINTMFKNAISKNEITVTNPKIWRPILALPDACLGYETAIAHHASGIYNIASFNTTVGELAENVAEFVRTQFNKPVNVINRDVQDYRNYKVSWQKATDELGFNPTQSLTDVLTGLKTNFDTFSNFDNPAFYNIDVFKAMKHD